VPEHEVGHERGQGQVEAKYDGGETLGRGGDGDLISDSKTYGTIGAIFGIMTWLIAIGAR
jgi:hypothetical protein